LNNNKLINPKLNLCILLVCSFLQLWKCTVQKTKKKHYLSLLTHWGRVLQTNLQKLGTPVFVPSNSKMWIVPTITLTSVWIKLMDSIYFHKTAAILMSPYYTLSYCTALKCVLTVQYTYIWLLIIYECLRLVVWWHKEGVLELLTQFFPWPNNL